MNVIWTGPANNDLNSIYEYIAADNPIAAVSVLEAIYSLAENLFDMPRRGREGRVPGTYELVLTKLPYTIVYRVANGRVEILRVIHHARLWPDML